VLFHNINNEDTPMGNEMAADVVLRATVAPTYFTSHKSHVDGGLFDLEPSSSALLLAMAPTGEQIPLEDIVLLSLGTGTVQRYVEGETSWGITQWLPKLMDMMWDGMVMKSINTCTQLLGDRYYRVQMHLDHDITLDDPAQSMFALATAIGLIDIDVSLCVTVCDAFISATACGNGICLRLGTHVCIPAIHCLRRRECLTSSTPHHSSPPLTTHTELYFDTTKHTTSLAMIHPHARLENAKQCNELSYAHRIEKLKQKIPHHNSSTANRYFACA
jgi:hypothetical protein